MLHRYRPIVLGGIVLWICAIISFMLPMAEQYLVGGFGILAGYVIPGLILRNEEK
jgi:hypothetical protein